MYQNEGCLAHPLQIENDKTIASSLNEVSNLTCPQASLNATIFVLATRAIARDSWPEQNMKPYCERSVIATSLFIH